jgi:hypothetical protein
MGLVIELFNIRILKSKNKNNGRQTIHSVACTQEYWQTEND